MFFINRDAFPVKKLILTRRSFHPQTAVGCPDLSPAKRLIELTTPSRPESFHDPTEVFTAKKCHVSRDTFGAHETKGGQDR
jgi:hypothetical protein